MIRTQVPLHSNPPPDHSMHSVGNGVKNQIGKVRSKATGVGLFCTEFAVVPGISYNYGTWVPLIKRRKVSWVDRPYVWLRTLSSNRAEKSSR